MGSIPQLYRLEGGILATDIAPNQVLVLGGGAIYDPQTKHTDLTSASIARTDLAGLHYKQNVERFKALGAKIVCSEGHERKSGQQKPPKGLRGANLMCDRLMNRWDISYKLLEEEDEAGSTFDNITYTFGLEPEATPYIEPDDIDTENPLALVSHTDQLTMAVFFMTKLGLNMNGVTRLAVSGNNDFLHTVFSTLLYRATFTGAQDPSAVMWREKHIARPLIKATVPITKTLKKAKQLV